MGTNKVRTEIFADGVRIEYDMESVLDFYFEWTWEPLENDNLSLSTGKFPLGKLLSFHMSVTAMLFIMYSPQEL